MDAVLNYFLQFGIGGAMTAVVITFVYYMTTKTIPTLISQREADLIWCRQQLEIKRLQFIEELKAQREEFIASLDNIRIEHKQAVAAVVEHCDKEVGIMSQGLMSEITKLGVTITVLSTSIGDFKVKQRRSEA